MLIGLYGIIFIKPTDFQGFDERPCPCTRSEVQLTPMNLGQYGSVRWSPKRKFYPLAKLEPHPNLIFAYSRTMLVK